MVMALLRTTRNQVATLKIDELIDNRQLKSSLRLLGLLLLPVSAMVLFNPSWVGGTISMLTRPLDHLPPTQTTIDDRAQGPSRRARRAGDDPGRHRGRRARLHWNL